MHGETLNIIVLEVQYLVYNIQWIKVHVETLNVIVLEVHYLMYNIQWTKVHGETITFKKYEALCNWIISILTFSFRERL